MTTDDRLRELLQKLVKDRVMSAIGYGKGDYADKDIEYCLAAIKEIMVSTDQNIMCRDCEHRKKPSVEQIDEWIWEWGQDEELSIRETKKLAAFLVEKMK